MLKKHLTRLMLASAFFFGIACPNAQGQGGGVNLSLWKNIATQRSDTVGSTNLNLGIFSAKNRLQGLGVNVLGSSLYRDVAGVQLAGFFNVAGDDMHGVQLAGITNVVGSDMNGLSAAGLVSIVGGDMNGLLLSGLVGITGGSTCGLMANGLLGITGNRARGLFFSGVGNIHGEDMTGCSLAGLLNVGGGDVDGVQVAGLLNVAGEDMKGLQLAPVNVAVRGKGLQVGVVNYYHDRFDGIQLGLVNANPQTRVQWMIFGGNTTKLNMGARFKNKLFYTILGGGTHYLDFGDKFSAALFYRAGLELSLYRQLYLSGDLGYQHIETFRNKHRGYPARLYALQARLNLEYRLTDRLGIFVTGGYGNTRRYAHHGGTYKDEWILEGGCVLFSY